MALFLDVDTEDTLHVGDTVIKLEAKSGRRARLRIEGPAEVVLERGDKSARHKEPAGDGRAAQ